MTKDTSATTRKDLERSMAWVKETKKLLEAAEKALHRAEVAEELAASWSRDYELQRQRTVEALEQRDVAERRAYLAEEKLAKLLSDARSQSDKQAQGAAGDTAEMA